jgi:RHS repeat-associated protein
MSLTSSVHGQVLTNTRRLSERMRRHPIERARLQVARDWVPSLFVFIFLSVALVVTPAPARAQTSPAASQCTPVAGSPSICVGIGVGDWRYATYDLPAGGPGRLKGWFSSLATWKTAMVASFGSGACGSWAIGDAGTINAVPNSTTAWGLVTAVTQYMNMIVPYVVSDHPFTCGTSQVGGAAYIAERDATCPDTSHWAIRNTNLGYMCVCTSTDLCDIPNCCWSGAISKGDPVEIQTGNKREEEVDYRAAGQSPLQFRRTYNSSLAGAYYFTGAGNPPQSMEFQLGTGWIGTYLQRLAYGGDAVGPTCVYALRPDGSVLPFLKIGSQFYLGGETKDTVQFISDAGGSHIGLLYTTSNDDQERYDLTGRLLSITTRTGILQTLAYNSDGQLQSVTDSFGHTLQFAWQQLNYGALITQVTEPDGSVIGYAYDGNNNLISVTYPNATVRSYLYELGGTQLNLLTGLVDENGVRYATWTYGSDGRATGSQNAGGVGNYTFSYGTGTRIVTDPLGSVFTYATSLISGQHRYSSASALCTGCGEFSAVGYDANGNMSTTTDFKGVQTRHSYDSTRNLELTRIEAFGTGVQRTITTVWESLFHLPTSITEANRTTAFTYDSSGNVLTRTLTDTTVSPNASRTWTYTYDSFGRVLTADGPRTDVSDITTYAYYSCTTGAECGQVHTVTDAGGHVTTYNTYNAHGQPLTITDANNVVTTLTYDLRRRLTSRLIAGETTTFDYWPTGLLKKVTQPDGSYVLYTYDNAHRLTQISDGAGNKISYTLDAMGNRTAESSYDPNNVLHRTHSRVINSLNQLYQNINAAGTAAVTTTYAYDSNGNQTGIAAPLSRSTGNQYDELNRLNQLTDPATGVTHFEYDANDNLISVSDPRSLTTSYSYSGFGDLLTQGSPDTGSTTNTYDGGGNLHTSTNARGAVATYAFDALNRPASVSYALGGVTDQTITFTYDAGTYGKGHLTGASDANHALVWVYDALGRVTSKTQTVGSSSLTVGYSYTNGDLTTLTTPSGKVVTYSYNSNHQVTGVAVNGIAILGSATYEPFGTVDGWTWGNGTATVRSFDGDGNISAVASAGSKGYSYDSASRITGITDSGNAALSWTYGYDLLDRLTSASTISQSQAFTYDANGNRLTQGGSSSSTFTVDSGSNRLNSVSGGLTRTYGYDAAGSTTSYAGLSFTYDAAGRMVSSTSGSATTAYLYNALGQRIRKSSTSAATYFAYDEAGHLIGEYDPAGNMIQEIVWLGETPVATVRLEICGLAIFYIHTDHLNTPRRISRRSTADLVWSWESDPFGATAPNENPSGLGGFSFNLRMPGQYFDAETGLNYNYERDYDPATGRYLESDPLGLNAGLNTYAYADDNPVDFNDPLGEYAVKGGVPAPSAAVDALLTCVERCYEKSFTVTATTDSHPAASPHGRGLAADIRYPSDPAKFLCCAGWCGAGFGLDEKLHPSSRATAPHIHIQLPPGTHGGRGDLPSSYGACTSPGCKK